MSEWVRWWLEDDCDEHSLHRACQWQPQSYDDDCLVVDDVAEDLRAFLEMDDDYVKNVSPRHSISVNRRKRNSGKIKKKSRFRESEL